MAVMTDYRATTLGLFPLPDWGKDELSSLKGHQKHDLISGQESEELTEVYDTLRQEVIETQYDAELTNIVEGQLRWDDMLAHPLTIHENVETRGLLRYYDNNNFYREPVVTGPLTPNGDLAAELEKATSGTGELQGIIPGPYSLADLATDEYFSDHETFLAEITEYLIEELSECPSHDLLFILEPSLVTAPPESNEHEVISELIGDIASASTADVVLQPYWGALDEAIYAQLLDTPLTGIGFDWVTAPDQSKELIQKHGIPGTIGLGIVDGQNTLVETPEEIQTGLAWFDDATGIDSPETIYASPNTELFYLPVSKFEAKLESLGAAAKSAVVA